MTQLVKKESITSLELLKEINFFRKKEREENGNDSRLLKDCSHDNLLKTIREEFSDEIDAVELNESKYYSNGKEYPMFVLTFSQSKQVLLKESKYVRKAVLQYIEKLEKELKEVLPKLTEMEIILKVVSSQVSADKKLVEHDEKLIDIENKVFSVINTVTIESNKQRKIQLEIANRVYKLLPEPQPDLSNDDIKIMTRKFFSGLHKDLRNKFLVSTYKDIKVIDYEEALEFIREWV